MIAFFSMLGYDNKKDSKDIFLHNSYIFFLINNSKYVPNLSIEVDLHKMDKEYILPILLVESLP